MILRISFKTPDALSDAIDCELEDSPELIPEYPEVVLNCGELLESERKEMFKDKLMNQCKKWFPYGEIVTVEIDTDADTCVVIKR